MSGAQRRWAQQESNNEKKYNEKALLKDENKKKKSGPRLSFTFVNKFKSIMKKSEVNSDELLKRVLSLAQPEYHLIVLSAGTLIVTTAVTLLLPFFASLIIDDTLSARANGTEAHFDPNSLAVGFFLLTFLSGGCVYARTMLLERAGNRIAARMRRQLFASTLAQDTGFFDITAVASSEVSEPVAPGAPLKKSKSKSKSGINKSLSKSGTHASTAPVSASGDILSRLTTDIVLVQSSLTTQAVAAMRAIIMMAGGIIMLLSTSTSLAFVSVGTLPPVFLSGRYFGRSLIEQNARVQKLHANATSVAEEILFNMKTVKQFVTESKEYRRYSEVVGKAHDSAIAAARAQASFDAVVTLAINGALLCISAYGGSLVLNGTLSPGNFSSFVMYSILLAANVGTLSGAYSDSMKAVAAAERIFKVIDRMPSIPPTFDPSEDVVVDESKSLSMLTPVPLKPPKSRMGKVDTFTSLALTDDEPPSVSFENVSFTYPARPEKPVIGPNFSLKVNPGEVLALVGCSGAGKSTVASLLTRLYDVDDKSPNNGSGGSIKVNGVDIRRVDPSQLRRLIGIVAQEPPLFSTTIAENIRYGRTDATDEEVIEAARLARVLEFANNFPEGLNTDVGSKGTQLSGGQKQRVAIARTLLKDPPIVIFDEATSALDAESEYHVKRAIDTIMAGRTVISIAHRLSTIRGADRITVMQSGNVVEEGTFEALVQGDGKGGAFRELMGRQLVGSMSS